MWGIQNYFCMSDLSEGSKMWKIPISEIQFSMKVEDEILWIISKTLFTNLKSNTLNLTT